MDFIVEITINMKLIRNITVKHNSNNEEDMDNTEHPGTGFQQYEK